MQVVSFFKSAYKAVYAQNSSDVLDHGQKRAQCIHQEKTLGVRILNGCILIFLQRKERPSKSSGLMNDTYKKQPQQKPCASVS